MYKSVISDGKFLIVVADGVTSASILELPTEELADKVAFELQNAWDEGEEWGKLRKWEELDREGYMKGISEAFKKFKAMTEEERDAHAARLNRRLERQRKVKEARIWRSVLSWKDHNYNEGQ